MALKRSAVRSRYPPSTDSSISNLTLKVTTTYDVRSRPIPNTNCSLHWPLSRPFMGRHRSSPVRPSQAHERLSRPHELHPHAIRTDYVSGRHHPKGSTLRLSMTGHRVTDGLPNPQRPPSRDAKAVGSLTVPLRAISVCAAAPTKPRWIFRRRSADAITTGY